MLFSHECVDVPILCRKKKKRKKKTFAIYPMLVKVLAVR